MSIVTTTKSFAMALQAVRGGLATLLEHFSRHIDIDNWVAAATTRWERYATIARLRQLGDRELKDIGLYRGGIGAALAKADQTRARRAQTGRGFEDATHQ